MESVHEADKKREQMIVRIPDDAVICAENLWFCLPDTREEVLKGLCFSAFPGQRVMLLGEENTWKEVLAKLFLGKFTPDRGCITVNGEALDKYAQKAEMAWIHETCESGFAETLKKLLTAEGGGTLLCFAARPVASEYMDMIYVMKNGRIAEAGTHSVLKQREGLYFDMLMRK